MRSNVLYILEFSDHKQLRQDWKGLQPNAERPEKIYRIKWFMNYDGSQ